MAMYQYMFNSCRVPLEKSDTARMYSSIENNYIMVLRNNHYYRLELKDNNGWKGIGAIESYVHCYYAIPYRIFCSFRESVSLQQSVKMQMNPLLDRQWEL